MKPLVLSGGSGTRLRPITHTPAKPLVPVAGEPVVSHGLESLAEDGITEVGTVVGDSAGEIGEAVGDGPEFGLDVTRIRQERPLGLAHAVLVARDFPGDEDFAMCRTPAADPRAFGAAELDTAGQAVGLQEKPEQPGSDEAVRAVKPSWRGESEITHALQYLVGTRAAVRSTAIGGHRKGTGNVGDMLEVHRTVLERLERRIAGEADDAAKTVGRVVIDEGVGAGTVVGDCSVGPYSSVADRRITPSEPELPIVPRDSSVAGAARIDSSLIGRHAPAAGVPRAHRLVLGDHGKVRIRS
ncbi:sugar phosphate nucleotidyltransferase [Streptomyces sp. NPDC052109]|uniref:sugar phosphate nucleotidyltransferase n=1 Tax=Streptomyces sp. NPDC052109 TaxID=3155527 RepID=UPI003430B22C